MPIEIHTKTGRETEVLEILKAWKSLYPKKFRFFKSALQEMRKVQKNPDGSFVDQKGRVARISIRAPTELWLFLVRRIPDWGKDHEDVELLMKVAGDFFSTTNKRFRRIHSVMDQRKKKGEKTDNEHKRDNDSEGLDALPERLRGESQSA